MLFLIGAAAFITTAVGGFFALRLKDSLHLILGFSAGAVIGVAFFDLLPEAFNLAQRSGGARAPLFIALGFIGYMLLDRIIFFNAQHEAHSDDVHAHTHSGLLGAGSLALHSLLDGLAIGLSFQVSSVVGTIVTIAVLTHDFSDGINTVSMVLKGGGTRKEALMWLLIDAAAPVVGIFSTLFFVLSESMLASLLAIFCGFFIYIGASDLLPESHHQHPKALTSALTILGITVMYVAVQFATLSI